MGRRNQNRKPKVPKVVAPDLPTLENCDLDEPEEFALWAMVALPGMRGAPLGPPVKWLRKVSRRLWDLGFRYHPELRTLKYRKPTTALGDAVLVSPGEWVPIDEPDDPRTGTPQLSSAQKALLRKKLGLDDNPAADSDKVPYQRADGTTVMVTPAQARAWANAKRARKEAGQ